MFEGVEAHFVIPGCDLGNVGAQLELQLWGQLLLPPLLFGIAIMVVIKGVAMTPLLSHCQEE